MDVSDIAGNVSDDDKARIKGAILAKHPKGSFSAWIAERLKLVKAETIQDDNVNAPSKTIYRVVHEIEACDGETRNHVPDSNGHELDYLLDRNE